jgi:HAMP domain-containing protein
VTPSLIVSILGVVLTLLIQAAAALVAWGRLTSRQEAHEKAAAKDLEHVRETHAREIERLEKAVERCRADSKSEIATGSAAELQRISTLAASFDALRGELKNEFRHFGDLVSQLARGGAVAEERIDALDSEVRELRGWRHSLSDATQTELARHDIKRRLGSAGKRGAPDSE